MKKTCDVVLCVLVSFALVSGAVAGQVASAQAPATAAKEGPPSLEDIALDGLAFRSIGPGVTGGRVIDIEVNPRDHSEYFVASAHGSLWKTTNSGVTFTPVFDGQSSFAMGAVAIDPSNPHVVWVGTGENNAHSFVVPGDGVYRSEDGGTTWVRKGLETSEQIGDILVHPQSSDIVWVAAYGPHRQSGGQRGVFKTTDGGGSWVNVLHPGDSTGCWELHMDPRDPDVLYAVAHQRQRYLSTFVTGGDESGIYKTTDGGETWSRLAGGLPQKMVGRIGMDISPVDPDVLYAVVDGKAEKGIYRSADAGASWTHVNDYVTAYPGFLQKLVCDTRDVDRVYALDIFNHVSTDGGRSWSRLGDDLKNVDNHTLWIDPDDNRHLLAGCDGGVYESFDMAKNWAFKSNMSIAEVYRVAVDTARPFYNVHIGTQDNNCLVGPSRTINSSGIVNSDWTFTVAGDGFETQVDWADPDIVYAESQFGGLMRVDLRTGERLSLRAFEPAGAAAYRFDWDAPLLVSRHDHRRVYHAGNTVLRSDDRGESWREISPDLTRGVPQELHRLMGRSWSIDGMVTKMPLAQMAALAESPLDENLLFAGSGDGLLHVTRDGGASWQRAELEGLPERARIHQITPSPDDVNVAYAACQNVFAGDYRPYLYKTTDGGAHWFPISANLPEERGATYTVAVDDADPDLLFVGTMNGVYVSNTAEPHWVELTAGIPASVQVMDLTLEPREDDLVVSTFGRGVFILDDYSPLRHLDAATLAEPAVLLPIADAVMFVAAEPLGGPGLAFLGATFFSAPNPPLGAVIRYYVKEDWRSLKAQRHEAEKKLQDAGRDVPQPSYEQLKLEAREPAAELLFEIADADGRVVRTLTAPIEAGVHSVVWDFRTSPVAPVSIEPFDDSIPWILPEVGFMVPPGTYRVTMSRVQGGDLTPLGASQTVTCRPLHDDALSAEERAALHAFNAKVAKLARTIDAADAHRSELAGELPYLERAILATEGFDPGWLADLAGLRTRLEELDERLNGDPLRVRFEGQARLSLKGRTEVITSSLWSTTSAPTGTYERAYQEARTAFGDVLSDLAAIRADIHTLEDALGQAGAPYTPGRMPVWEEE